MIRTQAPQQVLFVAASNAQGMEVLEPTAHEVRTTGLMVSIVTEVDVVEQLKSASAAAEEVAVVVFGPGVNKVLPLARRVRSLLRLTHFVFVPDSRQFGELKHKLSRAPMIGAWSVVEFGYSSLPKRIVEAANSVRRRAQLRTTLDRANVQVATPKLIDSHDYRRLVISEHCLKSLLSQVHESIISLDSTAKILYWSDGAERMFGLQAEQVVGRTVDHLSFWSDTLADYLDQVRNGERVITTSSTIPTPSGLAQVETIISSVCDDTGNLIGFSLFMSDVTERNQALEAEREALQKQEVVVHEKEQQRRVFESLLSAAEDQSYVLDLEGRFQYVNRALTEQLEVDLDQVLGRTFYEFGLELGFDVEQVEKVCEHTREVAITQKRIRADVPLTTPSGRQWFFEYILVPVVDERGQIEAIAGTTRDITDRKAASDRVWAEANYDSLTELPNRRLFRDRLELEVKHTLRNGTSLALFFVDLDHFKEVNDLYGHDAGDALLSQAAARIRANVRESDTVARLGGDEFTVILTDLEDSAHVEVTARKILDELARPFNVHGSICHVSASIGITLYPTDGAKPDDLIRNADQAMYVAKHSGRSRFSFFTRKLQDAALKRLRLQKDLREALNEKQLRLHFQPIISLADGEIVKAEALVRWEHPIRGLLLPSEFIALAEESGQITELGNWVFTEAANCSKRWSQLLGRTFQISINKSPIQFEELGHSMDWTAHLKELELAGSSILVEITEGVILNATPTTSDKLLELQEVGIELAIDDFGTGYSSMAYLKKFDVDYLKIDQSFVQDIDKNVNSRTIAESITAMGHKLGIKIVAEGIETEEQYKWLRSMGCDYGQGYLFSRPVQADQLEELLRAGRVTRPLGFSSSSVNARERPLSH
ncbi:bifunctional diguanylate cyclase/phosphodiesterase [Marinimicrobium sp. ABcell2]|uniref:sensor domain-containing protein n=1 Tax=Marinimicrobium sp. ABcell2 TaxID=3069751 RepID=UPI0027B641A3|nr:bifunctional diguanylate cyclase/phosphodiesterase [Marinimicrobium sp. ABcell2]MDQ2075873.1 EAL domain-containing protein [Marinimicrobium sp. ABcell2]